MVKSADCSIRTSAAGRGWSRRSLIAALAVLPAAARAQTAGREIVIPFNVDRNNLWVPVHVEGKGPYRFAVSLASDMNHLHRDLAYKLQLEPIAEGEMGGAARRKTTYLYRAKELRVGDLLTQSNSIFLGTVRGGELIDGAFVPAFKGYSVGFDFERNLLTLRPGPPPAEGFTALPILKGQSPNDRRVRVQGEIDGRPAVFFIDTGGDESLLLLPSFVRRHGLWNAFPKHVDAAGQGAAGPFNRRDVKFSRLKLGSVEIERPVGGLIDPASDFGVVSGDGVIGLDLLKGFHIWADLDRAVLYLKPNSRSGEPPRYNRSGLRIAGKEELSVASVAPGSAADKAGVRAGDGLLLPPEPDPEDRLLWTLEAPAGTVVELKLLRAGAVVPVSLTLEELL